jgi:NADP-dependent 3-hydroxy acid dehydrogenase YdfG
MRSLQEQTAVITGAGSGIGKAIAMRLAREGARLCLTGRHLEALETVAQDSRSSAAWVRCYQVDLTVDDDIGNLANRIEEDCGKIEMLIHSAGIVALGLIEQASIKDFDRQYRTNVRAPYAVTQALLPMLKSGIGQVVFINSSAGLTARAKTSQYAATKHGLKAVADSLREEVNSRGIRVLSIYPGRTAGPFQEEVHRVEEKTYHPERLLQPDDVADMVVNSMKLPLTAEVTDLSIRPFMKS